MNMTNVFSLNLVMFAKLAVILLFCVSNCLSSVVGSSRNTIAMAHSSGLEISKATSIHETCNHDSECNTQIYKIGHCWRGMCFYCDVGDLFNDIKGECEYWADVDDAVKVATGVIIAVAICIPITIIAGIIVCCFCCTGCAGYRYRQRRNQQPMQIIVNANAAYDQHGNPTQYQYIVPTPNNGQNTNVPVLVSNGPPPYTAQKDNLYENIDPKTRS